MFLELKGYNLVELGYRTPVSEHCITLGHVRSASFTMECGSTSHETSQNL